MNARSSGTYFYYGALNNRQLFLKIFDEEFQDHAFVFQYYCKFFFVKLRIRYFLPGFPMCECLVVSAYC